MMHYVFWLLLLDLVYRIFLKSTINFTFYSITNLFNTRGIYTSLFIQEKCSYIHAT